MGKNGVFNKPHARNGYIYQVKNEEITEVEYELGKERLLL